ncbi:MAG TPA: 3-dehydroquinate synthase [Geobacter sp.]|nr:3-dehydroquinate synthase [Geobacter sp.]
MKTIQQTFSVGYSYPVIFTRDAFSAENPALKHLLRSAGAQRTRVLTVIDSGVVRLMNGLLEKLNRFAEAHADHIEFVVPPVVMRGGEACKSDFVEVERLHALVERHGLCRHSFILAIGGGAVLDAAGFAAATAHRGIRLIRMPTTTLAMNDAGVGVKNGINAFGRKNFTGSFAPPFAVVNDFDFLRLLPARELRAGIAEAVKVALIRDRPFFDFLYAARAELAAFEPQGMERMIVRCAELHLEHIGQSGDPFEFGSSRPLDFGHWAAHKLEELSAGEIRHGEAVAIGIALDSLYSYRVGLIGEIELRRILAALEGIGFELYHPTLSRIEVGRALGEFREHLGGELSIPLLNGIGDKIDCHDIDAWLYRQCIDSLAARKQATGKSLTTEETEEHRGKTETVIAEGQCKSGDTGRTKNGKSELQPDCAGDSRRLFSGKPCQAP